MHDQANITGIPYVQKAVIIVYDVMLQVYGGDNNANTAKYHPFYITDDKIGGYAGKTQAEKDKVKVFAGPAGKFS